MPAPVSDPGLVTTRRTAPALLLRGELLGRRLSPREFDALARLANGQTRDSIRRDMQVSYATFRGHLHRGYEKLGVDSDVGAFTAMGWLTPPSVFDFGGGNYALSETWTEAA